MSHGIQNISNGWLESFKSIRRILEKYINTNFL
jgi:hypothetical protein